MPENIEPELTLEQLRALPSVEEDFGTPEGAVLCLEAAYRRNSIESVCACKNFIVEGTVALLNVDEDLAHDPEVRKKNALLIERAFRKATTEGLAGPQRCGKFFINRQAYHDGFVVVVEIRRSPDGKFTKLNHLVANTHSGWRCSMRYRTTSSTEGRVEPVARIRRFSTAVIRRRFNSF